MRLFVLKDDFRMHLGASVRTEQGGPLARARGDRPNRGADVLPARVSRRIRPAQDVSVRCGCTTALNEIRHLSEPAYEEVPGKWIGPEWCPGLRAAHMITGGGDIEIRDGSRFRWPGGVA
jgi:hypothetical protein